MSTPWPQASFNESRSPIAKIDNSRELAAFVARHNGPRRIITSFSDYDVLHMSGLDPHRFAANATSGDSSRIPRLHGLIGTRDGEWVVIHQAIPGYLGEGPRAMHARMEALRLPADLADAIAYSRVSDVTFDDTGTVITADHASEWPRYPLPVPHLIDGRCVMTMSRWDLFERSDRRIEADGKVDTGQPFQDLIDILDEKFTYPTPGWMLGARRGRLYLDEEVAPRHGVDRGFTLVITQGILTLWAETPYPDDGYPVAAETRDRLRAAGFDTDVLPPIDEPLGGRLRRLITGQPRQYPPYVDFFGRQAPPQRGGV